MAAKAVREVKEAAVSDIASYLDCDAAVSEIRQACDDADAAAGEERGAHRSPFFLVVGAGVSAPSVPLASQIIAHCQDVAKKNRRVKDGADSTSALDQYSHWFSRAYPNARQRQSYLQALIAGKPLSAAVLRLAHLLASNRLTNIVVTTNFDDFIARGLRLFGSEPAVCDHPRTVSRIELGGRGIQIVHVHGSYLFYDCANLRYEVTQRAAADSESSQTIVSLLDSVLWNRSPILVGYSGWEGDVVMSALRRRLRGQSLAQNVYWFLYSREQAAAMPSWLREHPDVRLVVPEAPAQADTGRSRRTSSTTAPDTTTEVLPALRVFDALNVEFALEQPELFSSPLRHFARLLESSLPDIAADEDPYGFRALIEGIRRQADMGVRGVAEKQTTFPMEELRTLLRGSHYAKAIELAAPFVPGRLGELDADSRHEVLKSLDVVARALLDFSYSGAIPEATAQVLSVDDTVTSAIGSLPANTAMLLQSRSGIGGYDTRDASGPHGAFSKAIVAAVQDARSDRDGDGRITLHEALIAAGERLMAGSPRQCPLVLGDAASVALFGSRGVTRNKRTLHAVIVGYATIPGFVGISTLAGPEPDARRWRDLVSKPKGRALFSPGTIKTLIGKDATSKAVRAAIKAVKARSKAGDIFLLTFAGYSNLVLADMESKTPNREFWFTDAVSSVQGSGTIDVQELLQLVGEVRAAHRIVIVDGG